MILNKSSLSPRLARQLRRITALFWISLFFLALHVLDDAVTTGEPAEYGVTVPEFLFYAALVYLILPPLGLLWARRGSLIGLAIVTLYGFQAMYGAGLNHVRHMFGEFGGSKVLPALLANFGITIGEIRGYGFGSVLMGIAGLGRTPPHTHTTISTLIAFIDIGLNAALIGLCAWAMAIHWQERTRHRAAPAPQEESAIAT